MNQELANKLIKWYEESISEIKEKEIGLDKALELCCDKKIEQGLCLCSEKIFGVLLYADKWINYQVTKNRRILFLCDKPSSASNLENLIERLQFRVDTLKTYSDES